jgi:hypothetical protein
MAELDGYGNGLDFLSEYQLSKEPLRVDVVVVRKRPGLVVDKNIGRIFRGHNLFEYKSPTDYISVGEAQKAFAYVWLYAAETGAGIDDITLSFVSTKRPEALFSYFKQLDYTVEEPYPGKHRIDGGFVPMQAVECQKLDGNANLWLKSLRNDISAEELGKLLGLFSGGSGIGRRKAYLNTVLVANAGKLREVMNMYVTQELKDVIREIGIFDDLLSEGEQRGKQIGERIGEQRGEQRGAASVLALLESGHSGKEIREMLDAGRLPRIT